MYNLVASSTFMVVYNHYQNVFIKPPRPQKKPITKTVTPLFLYPQSIGTLLSVSWICLFRIFGNIQYVTFCV